MYPPPVFCFIIILYVLYTDANGVFFSFDFCRIIAMNTQMAGVDV